MPLAAGDICRVTVKGSALGQLIEFVTHFMVDSTDSPGTEFSDQVQLAEELAGDGFGANPFLDLYRALLPTGYSCNTVSVQRVFPIANAIARGDYFVSKNGTGGAGPSAPNIACSVTLAHHNRGRAFQAKYHLGPLPDSRYSNGLVTNTHLTAMAAWATNMLVAPYVLNVAGGAHAYSVHFGIFHRNPIPGFTLRLHGFELFRLNNLVRTQRRRTIGVGK